MIYEFSWLPVLLFAAFVSLTLGFSFYLGRKARSSEGYFAAHGQIPWAVNGVAFAGDYLSAASFLGICGMIAAFGYDGFLYSIGFLAGWIVALFVIAEPMKRLGRFTFADAIDARFQSRGIKLAAGISTLAVSLFYLIPQMVGAGVLITPLLGLPHWVGVVSVGVVVILIVVTAGMVSTTWVQFLKGSLLVLFSGVLTLMVLNRGLSVRDGGLDGYRFEVIGPIARELVQPDADSPVDRPSRLPDGRALLTAVDGWEESDLVRVGTEERFKVFSIHAAEGEQAETSSQVILREAQTLTRTADGVELVNGLPKGTVKGEPELHPVGFLSALPGGQGETGPLGPLEFLRVLQESEVVLWGQRTLRHSDGAETTVYYQRPTRGSRVLLPGESPMFSGLREGAWTDQVNFLSLMLALFCGTASLPHILIRYYTVRDEAAARKSTIVGIGAIGCFYVLTLYMGLGAMTSGALDVTTNNMAAPLLAQSLSGWLFAVITAIAFTTVLGTVSGLILASSGAVAHDLLSGFFKIQLSNIDQVRIAKLASVLVGAVAIVLGILFEELNVGYLVGWAFSIAASANLPALVMLLFWRGTTRAGVIASIVVGMLSSLGWILLSADTFQNVYGLPAEMAWTPFSQPGIVTIPLAFLTLIVVSLASGRTTEPASPTALPGPESPTLPGGG